MSNNLNISADISSGLSSISSQLSSYIDELNTRMPDVVSRATKERKIKLYKSFSDSLHVKMDNMRAIRNTRGVHE